MKKKFLCFALTLLMIFALSAAAYADDDGEIRPPRGRSFIDCEYPEHDDDYVGVR